MQIKHIPLACAVLFSCASSFAQDQTLNIYSARHYPTDEALYTNFTTAASNIFNLPHFEDKNKTTIC